MTKQVYELNEGLYVNNKLNEICWVDIVRKKIILRKNNSEDLNEYSYPFTPSNIFFFNKEFACILDDHGIANFFWDDQSIHRRLDLSEILCKKNFRGNDGVMFNNNSFLFGSMHKLYPESIAGGVWLFENNYLKKIQDNFIPNTFASFKNHIFFSDSYQKKLFSFNIKKKYIEKNFMDLSRFPGNPDGGFVNSNGEIFLAMWGGSKIIKINKKGEFLGDINLNYDYPTNCKLHDSKIFITFAKLSDQGIINSDYKSFCCIDIK